MMAICVGLVKPKSEKMPQKGAKMAQFFFKMAQDGSKMAQNCAKMAQAGSKMAQNGANMLQKRCQAGPKLRQKDNI